MKGGGDGFVGGGGSGEGGGLGEGGFGEGGGLGEGGLGEGGGGNGAKADQLQPPLPRHTPTTLQQMFVQNRGPRTATLHLLHHHSHKTVRRDFSRRLSASAAFASSISTFALSASIRANIASSSRSRVDPVAGVGAEEGA